MSQILMLMLKLFFTLILLLNAPVVTYAGPIVINELQALSFSAAIAGVPASIVTAPADANAAVFDATGDINLLLTASVVESSVFMDNGGTGSSNTISIGSWTFGGSLTDVGGSGTASFDALGVISNMRIGATAVVEADDNPGFYQGTATMRLVYQ